MFGFIKFVKDTLFGGDPTEGTKFVMDSAKGIGNWIDERKFTTEEEAKMNFETGKLVLSMVQATRDENSTRSVTRRYLAWGIMGSFLLLIFFSVFLYKIDLEYSKFVYKIATESPLGTLAAGVGTFYFLSGLVRNFRK